MSVTSPARVHVLETTLRDGSYEIDFQFTRADTALLAAALDEAGFSYIEVGHGAGIGADDMSPAFRPPIRAAETDRVHVETARQVVKRAKLGVIVVAGTEYSSTSLIRELAGMGIDYVRLAYFPATFERDLDVGYIEVAKEHGLLVSINLMKTYSLPTTEVARLAGVAARKGADWFYVVDSAGGMTANDVREYVRTVRDATGMTLGLHAHNNSGLAVANSLAAIEAGATLVDSSLQGIGRATGNAPTEQLVLALQRQGQEQAIDRELVLRLGQAARGLFAERGNDSVWFASGAALLHSRVVGKVQKLARDTGRPATELLLQLGKLAVDENLLPEDVFPDAVMNRAVEASQPIRRPGVPAQVAKTIAASFAKDLPAACEELFVRSLKRRVPSVLHLVLARDYPYAAPVPWQGAGYVGLTAPVGDSIPKLPPGRGPHHLFVDEGLSSRADLPATISGEPPCLLPFALVCADAAAELVAQLAQPGDRLVTGEPSASLVARRVQRELEDRGLALTGTGRRLLLVEAGQLAHVSSGLREGDIAIVMGRAPGLREAVDLARAKRARVMRPPFWWATAARAALRLRVKERLAAPADVGAAELRAVDALVAPGSGEAVADALDSPTALLEPGDAGSAEALAERRARSVLSGTRSL